MKYPQNISGTFFNKARVFLSRGGLLGNKGALLEKEKTNYSAGQKTLNRQLGGAN